MLKLSQAALSGMALAILSLGAAQAAEAVQPYRGALKCQARGMDDVWLDQRLACISPGQKFIVNAAGASGLPRDVAYVVNEAIYDKNFYLINDRKVRYYQSFLCVRNAPQGIRPLFLSGDLANALKLSNLDQKPDGVGPTSVNIAGGDRDGWEAMPCDPARHPLIVDYGTGMVVSVNPMALPGLKIYQLPYH
ncbi:hypothetical protein BI347_07110 [Chromobacterium sphagni]|uniref:Uncharacterized protein n=1 Tax=Chromobacterium sphagni TaxID=1903179 RepID=A0A1S1X1A0_9NEIS|nr:hypothetical protein [Chromobacterium sphagni]OHX13301.1 hypothetical protein BI347_07110 [Chromobacterium sphagni]